MKIKIMSVSVAAAIAAWASPGSAQETVNLPVTSVFGAQGELNGVRTTGAGTLNVGNNQNINTSNNAGGAVTSNANDTANIVFGGGSTVTGFTGSNGTRFLSISAGAVGTTVNFNGAVFSTAFNVTGTGTVNFNGNTLAAAGLTFAGDGFVNLGANRTLTGAIFTNTANTGTLTLNGGSIVDGAIGGNRGLKQINVVGGNAAVGILVGHAVQARDFSLGTNTLSIGPGGALTPNPGATIATSFATNAVFGNIAVAGNSNVTSAVTVIPTVNGPLTVGTTYTIVDGTAGGTIGTPVNVINNSPLFTFTGVPVNIQGDVQITLVAVTPLAAVVSAPAAAALGASAAAGSDLATVQNALFALPNAAALNSAVAQLSPGTTNLAAPWVAGQTTRLFDDLWMARVDEIQKLCCSPCEPSKSGGPVKATECKGNDKRSNWWGKGFASEGRQGNVDSRSGYKSEAFGLMLAHDMPLNSDTRIGLGGGYANTTIDGNNSTGHTKIDSYQLTAYASHAPGPWFVQGAVTAGVDQYKGSRNIAFTGVNRKASADYSGQQYSGIVTAGRHFNVNQTIVTPLAALQASRIRVESYTEKGAGDANLRVGSQDYDFVQSTLGVKAERVMQADNGTYSPEVHLKWMHDFSSTTMQQDAAFFGGGSRFRTQGIKQDRELFNVGAGVSFLSCNCGENAWTVKGLYDYKWNDSEYSSHKLSLMASRSF